MEFRKGCPRRWRRLTPKGLMSGINSTGRGRVHGREMNDRDSTGVGVGVRERAICHSPGKAAYALERPCADVGRRQALMEFFWHNKYSVGHHEYSIRQRLVDRALKEPELTGGGNLLRLSQHRGDICHSRDLERMAGGGKELEASMQRSR